MKHFCFIMILLILLSGCTTYRNSQKDEKFQLMQDYILYKSLILSLKGDSCFSQDATLGVYNDLGSPEIQIMKPYLDKTAQDRVDSLKSLQIQDYEGKKAIFLNLLDAYNNPENQKKLYQKIKNGLNNKVK